MNDDTTLAALRSRVTEVREALGDVRMTTPASEIIARAQRRRTRRGLAVAGAACAAIGLAVTLALPSGGQGRPVHIHLAAWSVDTNPNGTVSFKLRNTSHPALLQHVLAEAGVPAMVRWGEICLAQGRHELLPTQGIVSYVNGRPTQMGSVFLLMGGHGADEPRNADKPLNWAWTITPTKIPKDARFVISAEPSHGVSPSHIQAAWEFVPGSARVTCATAVKP